MTQVKKLYLKNEYVNSSRRISTFIKRYFESFQPTSYYDFECKKIQCNYDSNRSIYDIYYLVCGRFKKKISFNKFLKIFSTTVSKNKIEGFYCSNIKKVVFYGTPDFITTTKTIRLLSNSNKKDEDFKISVKELKSLLEKNIIE